MKGLRKSVPLLLLLTLLAAPARARENEDCLACHGEKDFVTEREGKPFPLFVGSKRFGKSVHKDLGCVSCHADLDGLEELPHPEGLKKVQCGTCHEGEKKLFDDSLHGKSLARGDELAPDCQRCHGSHYILPVQDRDSAVSPLKIPYLCGSCHQEGAPVSEERRIPKHNILKNYSLSIHGEGLFSKGLTVAATCASCHTAHHNLPHTDPRSTIARENIVKTCTHCHGAIQAVHRKIINGELWEKDPGKIPVCVECHQPHKARKVFYDQGMADADCLRCHGKKGLRRARDGASLFVDKGHLHGSTRRQVACVQCHKGANKRFAGYLTHSTHHDPKKYPLVFWTFWIMTSLLVGTFGFFGLHTLLWLPRSMQMRLAHPHHEPKPGEKQFKRFTDLNRFQHVVMILTFITLALTGMMLKFSYTKWAVFLAHFFGGFESAAFLHRTAAVTMFGLFASHLWDLIRRKRAECGGWLGMVLGPNSMVPNLRDLKEFIGTIKWYVGAGPRPQYGRWTYWEKFDYFAVSWGIAIIGTTGLMLWFPETVTKVLPGWLINVAGIIHGDEAPLAVGFIFTVHFFNTHFRPEKFPMDLVVFTGRMPLEEFKRERPEEYEALQKSGKLDDYLVEPPSPGLLRAAKAFGWAALSIGIALVVGIIYAVIFAYT